MPKHKKPEGRNNVDLATDYEYEAEDANVQQAMRHAIKFGENAPLLKGDLKAGQRTRSPEGTSVQGFGTTSDIKGKGKGKPLSFKDIEQGFEKNLKTMKEVF